MPYTDAEKKKVITRLRRFSGQAHALELAIAQGMACADALQQLAALRGAVNSMMAEVLEIHLRETLLQAEQTAERLGEHTVHEQTMENSIEQAVKLIRTYLK